MKLILIFRKAIKREYLKKPIGEWDNITVARSWELIDERKPYKLIGRTYLPIGDKLFSIYDKIHWSFLDKIISVSKSYDFYKSLCENYKIRDTQYHDIVRQFTEKEIKEEAKKIKCYYKQCLSDNLK